MILEEEDEDETDKEVDPLLGTLCLDDDGVDLEDDSIDSMPMSSPPISPKMSDIMEHSVASVQEQRLSGVVRVSMQALMMEEDEHEEDEKERKAFEIENDGIYEKQILFFVDLSECLEWESRENGHGMRISRMKQSEYGKALLVESGIEIGCEITIINGDNVRQMMEQNIRNRLSKCDNNKGFRVTFVRSKKRRDSNLKPTVFKKSKKKTND